MSWYGIVCAALVAVLGFAGCSSHRSEPSRHSFAYKLYAVDHGTAPTSEHARELVPYKNALAVLGRICTNRESRLADMAVTVRSQLRRKRVKVTTYRVLSAVVTTTDSGLTARST